MAKKMNRGFPTQDARMVAAKHRSANGPASTSVAAALAKDLADRPARNAAHQKETASYVAALKVKR